MNAHTHRLVFNLRRNSPIAAPESARSCGRGRQAGRQRRQGGRRRGACANRLALNPATTQKRLGDGFYEQRLITEQIAQLTGRRFLTGYQNDEAQYQALMEAGATFAKTWQLIPGIALTAEQMARLTSDIVWLVEKEVAGQKVLVPQVYARVEDGDLAPSGALLAGAAVNLDTATELINSGRIAGRQVVSLTAENIKNLGGDVAGKEIFADARKDLQLKGGSFTAESRLIATAGRDLTVESSTVDLDYRAAGVNGSVRRTDISRVAGLYVTGDNGTLVASAGNDLALLAAAIVNSNPTAAGPAGGTTATTLLAAGNNLMLGTVTETRDAATSTKKTRWSESATTEVGSSIQTAGDLTLTAGNDLTARAATVQSGGAIDAAAGNDLTIETGQASYASDYTRKSSSSGFLSKKRTTTHNTSESTTTIASTFSGDRVTMTANRDIGVKGSNVVATNDTTLAAGRDIAVEAAIDTYRSSHVREKTKSGTFSTGLDATNKVHEEQRAQGSVISAGRDLSITAGAQTNRDGMPEAIASASSQQGSLIIQGSALDAGRDLAIQTTGDLLLLAAYSQSHETTQRTTQTRRKLETLNFDLDQTRALLATLTAGNSIDLNVGGNVAAQIGSMDSSGNLQADRMTATGVIKGSDRQQVSLTHTSDKKGTTTNGPTSKVLGNLAAQGIRSGAADSFAPEALQSGQAAVTALMQNGLLTITNQPAIQAALGAPTPNGSALTFKDDSGRVTLTLAGEAKVQAVYNQLKLTETFDVKHFADQGTAQVVTLVAAIALTVCTGGAGAGTVGAALTTAGSTSAMMINAAFIAMASTMTGQLAAGASFDEAFQVALKAGATSAISAGIASGIDQYVNGAAGGATPTTIQSGTQSVQGGSYAAASGLSNLDRLGTAAYWQQTALNATAQGTLASLQGGSFKEGFAGSVIGSLSASGAGIIGDSTAGMPLANIAAHAVLGCASAAAGGKDCAAGAIGGAGSATVARLIDSALTDTALSETTKNTLIASGSVVGSMAIAGALGKDLITAGNAAGNEVLNNYLKHREISTKLKELDECKGAASPGACAGEVERRYNAISRQNSDRLIGCKTPDECRTALAELDADKAQMQSRREELERRLYANELSAAERREYQLLNDNIDNAYAGGRTIAATEVQLLQRLASTVGPLNLTPQESERMLRTALMTGGGVAGAAALARGRPTAGAENLAAGERVGAKGGATAVDDVAAVVKGGVQTEVEVLSGSKLSHINGSIGELRGYQSAVDDLGQVGIQKPGKVTVSGPDYITYDPASESVVVWDAKYRAPGGSYPRTLPTDKVNSWMPQVREAIQSLPPGSVRDAAMEALQNGRIQGLIFRWPN